MAMMRRVWRWGDLAVAVTTVLVAVALWGYAAWSARAAASSDLVAVVRTADGVEQSYPLRSDDSGTERAVQSKDYHYILRFEGGRVRVLTADCPDKVCVVTGWLSKPGQLAACVPGRLLVRIEASSSQGTGDPGVDAVSQ